MELRRSIEHRRTIQPFCRLKSSFVRGVIGIAISEFIEYLKSHHDEYGNIMKRVKYLLKAELNGEKIQFRLTYGSLV